MKNITLLLSVLILLPLIGISQCYEIQQRPYYPDPYVGGLDLGIVTDDTHSQVIDLGFPFCFFGDTVTQVVVSSNGYLTFDLSNANEYSPWPISESIPDTNGGPKFSILAPWQDTHPGVGGTITTNSYGVPPYRRFVLSYHDVAMFYCDTLEFSNQVVVYESLNVVDVNIAEKPLCPTWNNGAAIEGIVNQDGTEAYVVPGRNFPTQWTAQNDSYRFVPMCDCPTDSLPDLGLVPGKVFWDENSDCIQNQNEVNLANVRIDIQPGNGMAWTNENGEFALMLEPGNYTFEHSTQNPSYLINNCQNGGVPVTVVADSNALDVCFADSVVPIIDLSATISTNAINACFINSQNVQVCNYGTIPALDVQVSVQIPSFTGTSNNNFTATSDSTWELTIPVLQAGECNNYNFSGIANCDSSMIGQVACLSASVTSPQTDVDTTNNQMSFCDSVGVSYDPNDIRVLSQLQHEGWRKQEYIDSNDEMTYMVRFQNTGTGPAYNVIVNNPLSGFLDHQSVELIAASHTHYMQMIDGQLSVHFLGIQLPDSASDPIGSQGYFIYKIKQVAGNPLGTLIENQAEIFFDFNAPVATNTTENEIELIASIDDYSIGQINIYPNPTTGEILLSNTQLRNEIHSVQVIDVQGRMLLSKTEKGLSKIDLSKLSEGIYILSIQTDNGTQVKRVVKN